MSKAPFRGNLVHRERVQRIGELSVNGLKPQTSEIGERRRILISAKALLKGSSAYSKFFGQLAERQWLVQSLIHQLDCGLHLSGTGIGRLLAAFQNGSLREGRS
jgi:hypothetical protein